MPYSHTRPRSLRSRSTSMMCSARSLGSRLSSSVMASSSGRRDAARPRAGDGPRLGPAVDAQRDQPLRRRRDQLVVAEVQVAGEGRRVHGAQRRVEVQARQRVHAVEALREVGLEDVAREHVLAGAGDHRLVLGAREVGAEHRQVVAVQRRGGAAGARAAQGRAHARRHAGRRAPRRSAREAVDEQRLAGRDVEAQQPARQEDVDVRAGRGRRAWCPAGARGSAPRRRR